MFTFVNIDSKSDKSDIDLLMILLLIVDNAPDTSGSHLGVVWNSNANIEAMWTHGSQCMMQYEVTNKTSTPTVHPVYSNTNQDL